MQRRAASVGTVLVLLMLTCGLAVVVPAPAQAVVPSEWGLTSFCTPAQFFPDFRRFRVRNSSGAPADAVLRNQTNGQSISFVAPTGDSFHEVPANLANPTGSNTVQLYVEGVYVAVKASNNKACSTLVGSAVCNPGTSSYDVTWTMQNNGTGPSSITASSIPGLVFAPNPVPANARSVATETVPAPGTPTVRTLTLTVDLGSSIIGNPEASVTLGQCGEPPPPTFTFTKTPDVTDAVLGQVVTYTYEGTNTSTEPLEVVQLVDDRLGVLIEEPQVTIVQPGDSLSRQVPYTVDEEDAAFGLIENAAVVTVRRIGGASYTAVAEAVVTVQPIPIDALVGSATCDPSTGSFLVEWTLSNGSTGEATVVSSSRPLTFEPATIPSLAKAVATETIVATSEVQTIDLTVELGPSSPGQRPPATVDASVTLGLCEPRVAFTFTKTPDRTTAKAGDVVTYTYSGTNTGNVPLAVDQLVDDRLGVVIDAPGSTLLPPGGTISRSVTYTVTAEDANFGVIDNAAVVSGRRADLADAPLISAVARASVVVEQIPVEPDPPQPSGSSLAASGSGTASTALVGVGLLLVGVVGVLLSRRPARR